MCMFAYLHALHREGGETTHACIMKKGQRWVQVQRSLYTIYVYRGIITAGNIYTLQHCTLHVCPMPPTFSKLFISAADPTSHLCA